MLVWNVVNALRISGCAFIAKRLRLEVNATKSAVARPEDRHFLGFSLRREPLNREVEIGLSQRTRDRLAAKVRALTPRTWGGTLKSCMARVSAYVVGWIGFFGICTEQVEGTLRAVDAHIRRRLRALQLRHWKRKPTIVRKLIGLGVSMTVAWRQLYAGRRSWWALSHTWAVERALSNSYWDALGLGSLVQRYRRHSARTVAITLTQDAFAW